MRVRGSFYLAKSAGFGAMPAPPKPRPKRISPGRLGFGKRKPQMRLQPLSHRQFFSYPSSPPDEVIENEGPSDTEGEYRQTTPPNIIDHLRVRILTILTAFLCYFRWAMSTLQHPWYCRSDVSRSRSDNLRSADRSSYTRTRCKWCSLRIDREQSSVKAQRKALSLFRKTPFCVVIDHQWRSAAQRWVELCQRQIIIANMRTAKPSKKSLENMDSSV